MANLQFPRFDLYRELGIEPSATQEEVEAAWKSASEDARSKGPAAQRIQRLTIARQWLGDPDRRAQYDRQRAREAAAGSRAAAAAAAPVQPRPVRARTSRQAARSGPSPWLAAAVVAAAVVAVVVIFRPFGLLGGAGSSAPPSASPSAVAGGSASPGGSVDVSDCPSAQPAALPAGETRTVTIDTELGQIVMKLDGALSPIAVGNFVALAACGWYDNVVFHRVVQNFVVQGGDGQYGRVPFDRQLVGTGGPVYRIQDEPVTAQYSRGTVAMARSSGPNSVGSQFFIVLDDQARGALTQPGTGNYQIIGAVTTGMEVADAIEAAADADIPSDPVVMTRVTVANP
jgi:peptidyl-prolyl cis-trans isomerase B (cyclophilin B)